MAKKKGVEKPPHVFTKRQISSIKRQKRRKNIILYSGITIIAAIVITLLVGLYVTQIRPYNQTVLKVYDREFSARYFMDTAEYVGALTSVYVGRLDLMGYQQLIIEVPGYIERSEIMRLGAAELGITASDDEAKEYIKEQEDTIKQARRAQLAEIKGQEDLKKQESIQELDELKERSELTEEEYLQELEKIEAQSELREEDYRNIEEEINDYRLPVSDASIDLARSSVLGDRVNEEYIKPDIPATADQVNMMVMLLESAEQAYDIAYRLEGGEEFPTLAEEHSLDQYSKGDKGDLGWHIREKLEYDLGSAVPVDYAFGAAAGALSQPLSDENLQKNIGYWMVNVLERQGEQAHLQVILLGSQWEADIVIQRIINGESFEALAREFSQDAISKDQGGELGMVSQGIRTFALDEYVFGPDASDMGILGPIRDEDITTRGGYWLVEVVDREDNRPIEEEDAKHLEDTAYQDWLLQLWEDATDDIDESNLTPEVQQWMLEKLTEE